MSYDYATPSFRKSRKEKQLKRRNRVYKRGGKHRSDKIDEFSNEQDGRSN